MSNRNEVWFITGCSTGFGREFAKIILEKGWKAVITARSTDKIKDLAKGHEENALLLELDVTDQKQISEVVKKATDKFGKIDVLVNNAGYGYFTSIEEAEQDKIRDQFETNFFGLVNLIQAVLPGMRERRHGTIINFSSIGGLAAFAATGFYHATKFAVEGLSESLSKETAPFGVRVLIVEPGPFRTDWAGRSVISTPVKIKEYEETVGARMKTTAGYSGTQKGDPIRACHAIIKAVEDGVPHLRLLLGRMAFDFAQDKLNTLSTNFDAWKELSLGADYPDNEV